MDVDHHQDRHQLRASPDPLRRSTSTAILTVCLKDCGQLSLREIEMILICSPCLIDAAATSKDQHTPGADCRLSSCSAHLLPTFCKHLTVTEPRRPRARQELQPATCRIRTTGDGTRASRSMISLLAVATTVLFLIVPMDARREVWPFTCSSCERSCPRRQSSRIVSTGAWPGCHRKGVEWHRL